MKIISFPYLVIYCFSCVAFLQDAHHGHFTLPTPEHSIIGTFHSKIDKSYACPRCRRAQPPGPRKRPANPVPSNPNPVNPDSEHPVTESFYC